MPPSLSDYLSERRLRGGYRDPLIMLPFHRADASIRTSWWIQGHHRQFQWCKDAVLGALVTMRSCLEIVVVCL